MKHRIKKNNKEIGNFAGFVLPSFFIWFTVVFIPFMFGIIITFTDWNGLSMSINPVGLKNYNSVFSDSKFLESLLKTLIYSFSSVILSNLIGFLLALALTSGMAGQNFFRSGFFTPNIIGGIILGYIWNFVFSYALTAIGKNYGISFFSKSWLTQPNMALLALIIVSTWQLSGYLMVIYISGLSNIPTELIEAAEIDGASKFQLVTHIKVAMVRNSIAISIFLAIARTFMSYDVNLSLTSGGPYKSTELIAYKIYQTAFTSMEFGKGQAQAAVLFVMVATVSLLQVHFTRGGEA